MALSDYSDLINQKAQQYGVDPNLLTAIVQQESGGNPNAVGPKTPYGQARGLAGILDSTAQANNIDATKPDQSIDFLARTMAANLKQTGDTRMALRLYQGGPDPTKWGQDNAAYPDQVLAHYTKDAGTDSDLLTKLGNPASVPPAQHDDPDLVAKLQGPTHAGWRATGTGVEWYDPNKPVQGTASDVLKSGATGVVKGAGNVVGMPGDIRSIAANVANAIGSGIQAEPSANPQQNWLGPAAANAVNTVTNALPILGPINSTVGLPTSAQINQGVGNLLGRVGLPFHTAQSVPGQYAQTIGEFAPGALVGEGTAGQNFLRNALLPALGSETAGQISDQNPIARFIGAMAPGGITAGARKLLGVGSMDPRRIALAQKAIDQFGIDLRGSQISPSNPVRMADSAISRVPLSGLGPQNARQGVQFTRALASMFGSQADNITPPVMDAARDRIGGVLNRTAANTTINANNAFTTKLFDVYDKARGELPENELKPIENQIDNILSTVDKNGQISGRSYQNLIRKGGALDRGANAGGGIGYHVRALRDVLDDGAQAGMSGQDLKDFREARLQYKNLMVASDLAAKAGIEGEVTPASLLGAVRKHYKNMPFKGAGEMGDLADVGTEFLKETPSSTTPERLTILKALELAGLGGAAALGIENAPEQFGHAALAAATLVGGARGIGTLLRSKAYRNALLNNSPANTGAVPAGLLAAHNLLNPTVNYGQ